VVAPDRDIPAPLAVPRVPNVARIYDYLLGGKDNFVADRVAADTLIRLIPDGVTACRENRRFVRRAVRYLAGEGIRQFIDIGTGLPTQGNVHEVALEAAPDARVVYADYDPVVVAHARALLAKPAAPAVAAISGDLRHPEQILQDPELRALLRLDQPFAVLATAVLHFISDDENPEAITRTLAAAMPPGSYLVISHITPDNVAPAASRQAQAVYADATAQAHPRTRAGIARFFGGLELAEPGVVSVSAWRPEPVAGPPARTLLYAGVARKPLACRAPLLKLGVQHRDGLVVGVRQEV
jgi:S-adenosyl methyltransferase